MTMGDIENILKKYWGYDAFLPLQKEAMKCVLTGKDSVVVMPTGGGKSLCYQAPALMLPGLAMVVSPLISLMKDQVDALVECGIPAARFESTQSPAQRSEVTQQIRAGRLKLLYLSPERLMMDGFVDFIKSTPISLIAVDEAHCVSMWGHDFRPEYRQLGTLKEIFPDIAIHAYTATATDPVREDIARQLHLADPQVLIGSFDRPNLIYKTQRLNNKIAQVREILDRFKGESGIIYCIRRRDVDGLCEQLRAKGYSVAPYHAGMADQDRQANQEAFITDRIDTIVATVAFGMGIDKPDVRYVIHTGMPKSLEHYQQESGRGGRDGLEALCTLLYSGGDYGVWKTILADAEPKAKEVAMSKLGHMYSYCTGVGCRHRGLLNYFGQDLDNENCGACDVCLGELDCMDEPLETAQKILSCIVRLDERFGADYTAMVLIGSHDSRILENQHNTLSTYGLLKEFPKRSVRDWLEQLVAQGHARKTSEFQVLQVTESGWEVMRGHETPQLLRPAKKPACASKTVTDSWQGVDNTLFEALRNLRRSLAAKKGVPAYVVFGDAALRDMARKKPATPAAFLEVSGVGEKKNKAYGPQFLSLIKDFRHNDPRTDTTR